MDNSQLQNILTRLQAMTRDHKQEVQTRHFEMFGHLIATVQFDHRTNAFSMVNNRDKREFIFDDIDLLALEIFEAMYQMKATF